MTPVAWMNSEGDVMPMPEIEHWCPPYTMLYTSDQIREAQVRVLREAAFGCRLESDAGMIRRMIAALEKQT